MHNWGSNNMRQLFQRNYMVSVCQWKKQTKKTYTVFTPVFIGSNNLKKVLKKYFYACTSEASQEMVG